MGGLWIVRGGVASGVIGVLSEDALDVVQPVADDGVQCPEYLER